jgi:diguanylate cyclase
MNPTIYNRLQTRLTQQIQGSIPASDGWPEAQGQDAELIATLRNMAVLQAQQATSQMAMLSQLHAILNNASVGIAFTRKGCWELVGQHLCRMLGFSEEEMRGASTRLTQISPEAFEDFAARVRTAFATQGYFDEEQLLKRKDGSTFWAHMLAKGVITGDPSGGTIWIIEDISEARAARENLSWAATHDSLTRLANRHEFESRLTQALSQAQSTKLCILFIDLDRFKIINDTAGHATGDEVLRQIAALMELQVRQSDTVARLGGDEFAVLLPGCPLPRAQQVAEQLRAAIDSWRLTEKGQTYSVGASMGVAEASADLNDMASLIHAADTACYEAKNTGRNRVCTHRNSDAAHA